MGSMQHETNALVFDFFGVLYDGGMLNTDVVTVINELRATGKYQIALLSNSGPSTLQNFMDELGINGLFDVVVASGATAYVKPQREIYEILEDKIMVPFAAWFYVDDSAGNTAAAQSYGIPSHTFTSAMALRQALKDAQILV
jgi:HAD superfamily hydrolase (TIGR01509 family)